MLLLYVTSDSCVSLQQTNPFLELIQLDLVLAGPAQAEQIALLSHQKHFTVTVCVSQMMCVSQSGFPFSPIQLEMLDFILEILTFKLPFNFIIDTLTFAEKNLLQLFFFFQHLNGCDNPQYFGAVKSQQPLTVKLSTSITRISFSVAQFQSSLAGFGSEK